MKKKIIFSSACIISFIANIIPLYVYREETRISKYSYVAIMIMILVTINGVFSYFLRHKGNFLLFGKPRSVVLSSNDEYTVTTKYANEFYWMFLLYCFAIPFYIPCVFFPSTWVHTLWTLCVLFAPQLVFIIYGILNTINDIKMHRKLQQIQEQELKEQQRREEMGFFK